MTACRMMLRVSSTPRPYGRAKTDNGIPPALLRALDLRRADSYRSVRGCRAGDRGARGRAALARRAGRTDRRIPLRRRGADAVVRRAPAQPRHLSVVYLVQPAGGAARGRLQPARLAGPP